MSLFTISASTRRKCSRLTATKHIFQVPISLLPTINREHVRWVALEYKKMLTDETDQYYVLRNCAYSKKMNLAEDI